MTVEFNFPHNIFTDNASRVTLFVYLTGHAGLTLGIAALLNRGKEPMSYKKIALSMGFALMPDALDRGLNLIVPGCPDHGILHSVFLYLLALPLVYGYMRQAFYYVSIMAMNVFFDVVNVDPRAFLYPTFGWKDPFHGCAVPALLKPVIQCWPEAMRYRFPAGHYLLFEAGGLFVIIWIMAGKMLDSLSEQRRAIEALVEYEKAGARFPEVSAD